jgi:hypothetical protein
MQATQRPTTTATIDPMTSGGCDSHASVSPTPGAVRAVSPGLLNVRGDSLIERQHRQSLNQAVQIRNRVKR